MKKLLALVLCVMLIVSVVPTSAFAATPTSQAMAEAYAKMKELGYSYSRLGAANAVKIVIDVLSPARFSEKDNPHARANAEILQELMKFIMADNRYVNAVGNGSGYLSYEGIFNWVGTGLYSAYADINNPNSVASGVALDAKNKIDELGDKAIQGSNEKMAEIIASANAAEQVVINSVNAALPA